MDAKTKQPLIKNSNGLTIKDIVDIFGDGRAAFCENYRIPMRTLQDWLLGYRNPPVYVLNLLEFKVRYDKGEIASH